MIAGKASPSTAEPTLRGRELFGGLFDHAQVSRVATQSEAGIGGYDYTEEIDGLVQEERVADDEIGFRRLVRAAVEPSPSSEPPSSPHPRPSYRPCRCPPPHARWRRRDAPVASPKTRRGVSAGGGHDRTAPRGGRSRLVRSPRRLSARRHTPVRADGVPGGRRGRARSPGGPSAGRRAPTRRPRRRPDDERLPVWCVHRGPRSMSRPWLGRPLHAPPVGVCANRRRAVRHRARPSAAPMPPTASRRSHPGASPPMGLDRPSLEH